MNIKKIITVVLFTIISFNIGAQNTITPSGKMIGEFLGFSIPKSDDIEADPMLTGIISENKNEETEHMSLIKAEKMKLKEMATQYQTTNKKTRGQNDPVYISGITANNNQGTPSDNSCAVNKNGIAISVVNSNVRYYNVSAVPFVLTSTISLASFFSTLTPGGGLLSNNLCDPKVLYDAHSDRFVVFAQTCDGVPSKSEILLAFSKTNNPTDGWWKYSYKMSNLTSSLGTNKWFDYPKFAISNHDVFVTGNIFNGSIPNSTFSQSVVFQINKFQGYNGITSAAPDGLVYSGISGSPFTLVPFKQEFGASNYTAKMAFASTNRPSPPFYDPSNLINLYEVNDSIGAATQPVMSYTQVALPTTYNYAADALQLGSAVRLDIGDLRGQDGFTTNGQYHFVFCSDAGGGYAGINYAVFNKLAGGWSLVRHKIISEPNNDLAFPAISSSGLNQWDNAAMIVCTYSNTSEYPGTKVVYCNGNGVLSSFVKVKAGLAPVDDPNYVDQDPTGSYDRHRWGDYSGLWRDYSSSFPSFIGFGSFGANVNASYSNWLFRVNSGQWPLNTTNIDNAADSKVYPNPIQNRVNIQFNSTTSKPIEVNITDLSGRKVKTIMSGYSIIGKNIFSFNKGYLPNGIYMLQVIQENTTIHNEKIIVNEQ